MNPQLRSRNKARRCDTRVGTLTVEDPTCTRTNALMPRLHYVEQGAPLSSAVAAMPHQGDQRRLTCIGKV